MTDASDSQDAVVIERTFDAPVDLIWQMWTDPEHFAAWYGPDGATIPVATMDVRVGGSRLISMQVQTPNGAMQMWFAGEYPGDHDPATGQFVEVVVLRQPLKHGHDVVRLLVAEAQQDHAAMAAGWVGAGIAKSEVEGDQSSLVGDGSGEHVGIGSADQLLIGNGIDVVAESEKRILGDDSDALVELEPHVVGESGRTSCLASQAP